MTNRQIGELAIGLLALSLFSTGLLHGSTLAIVMSGTGLGAAALAAPILLYVGTAWAFWSGRKWIAARLFDIEEPVAPLQRAAGIAVRILGLLLLFRVIAAAGTLISQLIDGAFPHGLHAVFVAAGVSSLVVVSVLATIFVFRPAWVVDHLLVHENGRASGDEMMAAVAFATVGIYTIANALPALVSLWFWTRPASDGVEVPRPGYGLPLLEHSLTLLVGILLLTGSQALGRVWKRIRSMPPTEP